MRAATTIMLVALLAIVAFAPIARASDEAEFDSIEDSSSALGKVEAEEDQVLEEANGAALCRSVDPNAASYCKKGDNVSRGAGFAASNMQGCVAASQGRGCEAVGNLFFPKCIASYHPSGSFCSENCPLGWTDEGTACVKTAGGQVHASLAQRVAGSVLVIPSAQPVVTANTVAASAPDNTRWGIVIDAGSSGSRVNIYSWPARTRNTVPSATEAPEVKSAGFPTKINPGISAVKVASEAGATLKPLVEYAKFVVPKNQHAETPIYFMCTAGMRLLAETAPQHAVAILDSVRHYLRTSGFKFDNKWALILPGQSEGVFAWISTNYLLRSLSTGSKTAAALDMGGASQQITFAPTELPIDGYFSLRVAEEQFDLYTYSYLRYGKDVGQDRLFDMLLAKNQRDAQNRVLNPCYWTGVEHSYKGVMFIGAADWSTCRREAGALMEKRTFCRTQPCAIGGMYQPPVPANMDIYAASSYYTTAQFFGCSGLSNVGCIEKNAAMQCTATNLWNSVKAAHQVPEKYLVRYCFDAAFVVATLVDGFQFDAKRPIYFQEVIGGTGVSWALGAILYQVGLVPVTGSFPRSLVEMKSQMEIDVNDA